MKILWPGSLGSLRILSGVNKLWDPLMLCMSMFPELHAYHALQCSRVDQCRCWRCCRPAPGVSLAATWRGQSSEWRSSRPGWNLSVSWPRCCPRPSQPASVTTLRITNCCIGWFPVQRFMTNTTWVQFWTTPGMNSLQIPDRSLSNLNGFSSVGQVMIFLFLVGVA